MWGVRLLSTNLSFPVTCVPHGAHANQAEDEGEGEGSSHLLGDAPVPLLELLQRISPIIPIFIWEVKV